MKVAVVLCILSFAAVAFSAPSGGTYTSKYDGVDLDEILNNKRLLIPYVNCVLEEGRCTADGKELKSHIKEALETDCAKCTEAQQKGAEKVFRHLINHEPEIWDKLKTKYDPTGKYYKRHEAELKA
uniref:Chemosensory protein 8 n=1 Tax=Ectropis obliqua TaxID=248899 RepID=A0A1L2BL72_ECTOB|nr:chemosensory protein 8 [Ectropis obliqua]ANA75030.1 putative chemosensory protein 12 [Ectropis obliqua]